MRLIVRLIMVVSVVFALKVHDSFAAKTSSQPTDQVILLVVTV